MISALKRKGNGPRLGVRLTALLTVAILGAACGNNGAADGDDSLTGSVRADGSSTVAPLTEAAAELFQEAFPGVRVTVGTSGTSGGFEKFCRGESEISNASRPIKETEIEACAENGITYEQVQVANDALSAVVHPDHPLDCITIPQLKQVWDLGSTVNSWGDIDGLKTDVPDRNLTLFGPGDDSGTYDYWTGAVNGEEGRIRTNYNSIGEDDNAAIQGISGDPWAMAYIPYSYIEEAAGQVKALEIENPETGECVAPTLENVRDGSYAPLGRELFIYPSGQGLEKPEVLAFMEFYIENQAEIAEVATFIPMTDAQSEASLEKVRGLVGGA